MRAFVRIALSLCAAALLAVPASAQGPRGMEGGPSGLMLLNNTSVQQELKISADQSEKVKKASEEFRAKHHDDFEKARALEGSQRHEKMTELRKTMNDESKKFVADVLSSDQEKRLKQIQRQVGLPGSLTESEVEKALKLTDDQNAKIKEITDGFHKSMRDAFESNRENRNAAIEKIGPIRKEAIGKATALLSDDQKAAWKDLTGEPFEIKWERPERTAR